MKKSLFKISFVIVTLSYLTSPVASLAFISPQSILGLSQAVQGGQSQLDQKRQEASQQCELESTGQNAMSKLGSLANPQSLQNILQKGFGEKLGDSLSKIWTEKIPGILQQQIGQRLPAMVKDGLSRQLPSLISRELNQRFHNGASSDELRSAFPSIVSQGIQTLLPQITAQALEQLVPQTLQQNLPQATLAEMQAMVPEIIGSSNMPARFGELVASTTAAFPSLNGKVSQADMNAASNAAVEETEKYALEGIAGSSGFNQLITELVQQMTQQITPLLTGFTASAYGNEFSSYSGGNWSNQSLDSLFNTGTYGILGNFSIEQNFFNPILTDIGDSLTLSSVNGIRDWQISNVVSNTLGSTGMENIANTPYNTFISQPGVSEKFLSIPNSDLTSVRNTYMEMQTDEFMKAYPGQFSQAEVMGTFQRENGLTSIASGAQSNVAANANNIGGAAANKFSWSGLGTDLKASFSSGMGDMVGGLIADNVPFVGGILGSIADKYLTQTLNQLLGVGSAAGKAGPAGEAATGVGVAGTPGFLSVGGTAFVGVATAIQAVVHELIIDFLVANQFAGETSSHTKTSNENEKTSIKQDSQRNNVLVQACTYEKQITNEAKSLVDQFYKYGPDARQHAYLGMRQADNTIAEYQAGSYKVSPGVAGVSGNADNQNGEGQPAISNVKENIKGAVEEKVDKVQTLAASNNSGNFQADAVIKTQRQITEPSFQQRFKSNTTKEQFESLGDPAKLADMTSDEFWNLRKAAIFDDFDSSWLAYDSELANQTGKAKELALAQYIANQGWNDIRECVLWNDAPAPGDLSAGIPDGLGGLKYCWDWLVLTPGSTNKSLREKTLLAPYDYAIDTRNVREDFIVDYLGDPLTSAQNLSQKPAAAQTQAGANPCPGNDPCPETGWKPNPSESLSAALEQGFENGMNGLANNLAQKASEVFNFGNYGGSGGGGGGLSDLFSGFDWNQLTNIFNDPTFLNPPAAVQIIFAKTKVDPTHIRLNWDASEAIACETINDWPGTDPLVGRGALLATSGYVTVLTANGVGNNYQISCHNSTNTTAQNLTITGNE